MQNIAPPNRFVRHAGIFLFALSLAAFPSFASAITIGGTPSKTATVGKLYSFTPTVGGTAGKTIQFWIQNRPSWASFNAATGLLSGTPAAGNVGTYSSIIINVTNGGGWVPLPTFSIAVSASGSQTPTISGTPAKSVVAGQSYSFKPTATVAAGKSLTFAIANKPAWAVFSTSVGSLAGTPAEASVATYSNIGISASDGTNKVSLPTFSITVTETGSKSATLSWSPPLTNSDGSTLKNLAGYRIYYGTSSTALNNTINVNSVGITTYVVSNLSPGTYYFAVLAYNTVGTRSNLSNIVSRKE